MFNQRLVNVNLMPSRNSRALNIKKKISVFKLDYTTEELKIFKATFFSWRTSKKLLVKEKEHEP